MEKANTHHDTQEKKTVLAARFAAVRMLLCVTEDKKFSGETKEKYLTRIEDKRERALATRLFEGCLERMTELDYIIDSYSKTPVKKMKPAIAAILRVTVYQIKFMDKIPVSAACNEAVNMAKKFGFAGLSGFVNGVVRNIARGGEIAYPDPKKDFGKYFCVRYSVPDSLARLLITQYGRVEAEKIAAAFLEDKNSISIRCITKNTAPAALKQRMEEAKITVSEGFYSSCALRIANLDSPERLPGFAEGEFYVQDESSMQAVLAAGIKGNEKVLDLCAAPGGKTILAADLLTDGGCIVSRDLTETKTGLIQENVKRCRIQNIRVESKDACRFYEEDREQYDLVIADVPCSGIGILTKKPDIKYFTDFSDLRELTKLQRTILQNAATYVKPGGTLIFSTCTINKEENEGGFFFLQETCGLQPDSLNPYLAEALHSETTEKGYLQMLPHQHGTDGFFVSRFVKPEQ